MRRDSSARTEGSLLLGVVLPVAVAACLLVGVAKGLVGPPSDAVNINRATSEEIALAFGVGSSVAEVVVARRAEVGGFRYTDQLAEVPLLSSSRRSLLGSAIVTSRLDLDTASKTQLTRAGFAPGEAERILEVRTDSAGEKSASPLSATLLSRSTALSLGSRAVVRTRSEFLSSWMLTSGGLLLLVLLSPIVIRRWAPHGDGILLPIVLVLAALGTVTLCSIKDPLRDTIVASHHVWGLGLGLLAMAWAAALPRVRRPSQSRLSWLMPARHELCRYTYLWALAAIALMVALRQFGSGPEGVRLRLGGLQPVEIVKLLLALFTAGYVGDRLAALYRGPARGVASRVGRRSFLAGYQDLPRRQDIGPLLGVFALALFMFLIVRDMGPALVIYLGFLCVLYLATGRPLVLLGGLALAVLGGYAAWWLRVGVMPVRIEMWLHPWMNSRPNGMQLGQGIWGMSSGGIWGSGLGLGSPGLVPRSGSDLVFASVGEQLGLAGSLFILMCYVMIIWRGLKISLAAQSNHDRVLAAALTSILACRVVLITAGVTGLLPLTGLTLPFLGYGNTALVTDLLLVGLLYGISRTDGKGEPVPAPASFTGAAGKLVSGFAVLLLCIIGVGRLGWLQVVQADALAGASIRTPDADGVARSKTNPRLLALQRNIRRGSIYDRAGRPLATSRLDEISKLSNGDNELARKRFANGRHYPLGSDAANVVGYLDPTVGGPVGAEKDFDQDLRGFGGHADLLPHYRAKDLPSWLGPRRIERGADVTLTLNAAIQVEAVVALKAGLAGLRDRKTGRPKSAGALVVLDPATGEVLASASLPSYDPNRLSRKRMDELNQDKHSDARLLNRATQGVYPPGSTLKVATAAAALEAGIDPEFACSHTLSGLKWSFGKRAYARARLTDDEESPAHRRLHLARALRVSCNLYFAQLGVKLGPTALQDSLSRRFGLRYVRPLDKFAADLPDNAYGQGTMLASPTEMAQLAAAVANRGIQMAPLSWQTVNQPDGKLKKSVPTVSSRPIGEENAAKLADMMKDVVAEGSTSGVFSGLAVRVAGKTGTAQNNQADGMSHSWFIGFSPASKPKMAFACVIENGGAGRGAAARAVAKLLGEVFGR